MTLHSLATSGVRKTTVWHSISHLQNITNFSYNIVNVMRIYVNQARIHAFLL